MLWSVQFLFHYVQGPFAGLCSETALQSLTFWSLLTTTYWESGSLVSSSFDTGYFVDRWAFALLTVTTFWNAFCTRSACMCKMKTCGNHPELKVYGSMDIEIGNPNSKNFLVSDRLAWRVSTHPSKGALMIQDFSERNQKYHEFWIGWVISRLAS